MTHSQRHCMIPLSVLKMTFLTGCCCGLHPVFVIRLVAACRRLFARSLLGCLSGDSTLKKPTCNKVGSLTEAEGVGGASIRTTRLGRWQSLGQVFGSRAFPAVIVKGPLVFVDPSMLPAPLARLFPCKGDSRFIRLKLTLQHQYWLAS